MQLVLEQDQKYIATQRTKNEKFGEKIGVIASLFGCWHKVLSRPITIEKQSYRTCIKCGARKHFNTRTLETCGDFHFPPEIFN